MTPDQIRQRYLNFFETKEHKIIPSASLVPENDPSTLFTGSGMQPLVPYLLGKDHPVGNKLVNSQKCFRAIDIDEVGDNRHTTFFEMLGNWSLGSYFKKEQLPWLFEFLTKEIGLPAERLWVTCFEGDPKFDLPRDTESAEIWASLGLPGDRILYYSAQKNWWSRSGVPENMPVGEPGGPDSEVFYDFGPELGLHEKSEWQNEKCHVNCDCGRFLEINNSVFMEYRRTADGFEKLPRQNVDFGGGLERLAMVAQSNNDIFLVNHADIIKKLEELSGKKYLETQELTKAFRIVADHLKAATFLIADGIRPSNVERGYLLRRLLRRAVRYADVLGLQSGVLAGLVDVVSTQYVTVYGELKAQDEKLKETIQDEENKFRETLARGLKEFAKGTDPFTLFTTYGFPIELTEELAKEKGQVIDRAKFDEQMKQHQEISKAGIEQKFKGGLADASEATTRLHTAHHLLLRALQTVLGPSVKQKGSNITQERLRLDFNWPEKMTDEQKKQVEEIVNQKIQEALPVLRAEMSLAEAEKLNAEHEFGAKYPARVSVYSIGPASATLDQPQFDQAYSIEFCGGPHVNNTREIGDGFNLSTPLGTKFRILKEEASSAGIRRIKAALN